MKKNAEVYDSSKDKNCNSTQLPVDLLKSLASQQVSASSPVQG